MTAVNALRFGTFVSPQTAGTITVSPTGTVSSTGGVSGGPGFAVGGGEAPGQGTFAVKGNANLLFMVFLPSKITLSNGTAKMQARSFTANVSGNRRASLDESGNFTLQVGATLSVGANQASGTYSGTYDVTVFYL